MFVLQPWNEGLKARPKIGNTIQSSICRNFESVRREFKQASSLKVHTFLFQLLSSIRPNVNTVQIPPWHSRKLATCQWRIHAPLPFGNCRPSIPYGWHPNFRDPCHEVSQLRKHALSTQQQQANYKLQHIDDKSRLDLPCCRISE